MKEHGIEASVVTMDIINITLSNWIKWMIYNMLKQKWTEFNFDA